MIYEYINSWVIIRANVSSYSALVSHIQVKFKYSFFHSTVTYQQS